MQPADDVTYSGETAAVYDTWFGGYLGGHRDRGSPGEAGSRRRAGTGAGTRDRDRASDQLIVSWAWLPGCR
jgi:hypothetical protein